MCVCSLRVCVFTVFVCPSVFVCCPCVCVFTMLVCPCVCIFTMFVCPCVCFHRVCVSVCVFSSCLCVRVCVFIVFVCPCVFSSCLCVCLCVFTVFVCLYVCFHRVCVSVCVFIVFVCLYVCFHRVCANTFSPVLLLRDAKITQSKHLEAGVTDTELWLKINEPTEKDRGKYAIDIFDGKAGIRRVYELAGQGVSMLLCVFVCVPLCMCALVSSVELGSGF